MNDDKSDDFEPKVILMTSDEVERRCYIFDREVVLFSRVPENAEKRRAGTVIDMVTGEMYDVQAKCETIRRLARYCTNLTPGLVENEPPEW